MDLISIYSTQDDQEISILESVFREEGVRYEVHSAGNSTKPLQKRILVASEDKEKARELLDQTGFATMKHQSNIRRGGVNKYILIFLALLVMLLVAILIVWFMNFE